MGLHLCIYIKKNHIHYMHMYTHVQHTHTHTHRETGLCNSLLLRACWRLPHGGLLLQEHRPDKPRLVCPGITSSRLFNVPLILSGYLELIKVPLKDCLLGWTNRQEKNVPEPITQKSNIWHRSLVYCPQVLSLSRANYSMRLRLTNSQMKTQCYSQHHTLHALSSKLK